MKKFILSVMFLASVAITYTASAGSIDGPGRRRDVVGSHKTDSYWMAFEGGERAEVNVRGDGSTDLDCYVKDTAGSIVAVDMDTTDYCVLNWFPTRTKKYKLEIVNNGNIPNAYLLTTN
jgi:hypothetical protein